MQIVGIPTLGVEQQCGKNARIYILCGIVISPSPHRIDAAESSNNPRLGDARDLGACIVLDGEFLPGLQANDMVAIVFDRRNDAGHYGPVRSVADK